MLDMARYVEVRAIGRIAPVQQQCSAVHPRDCGSKGNLDIQIEDSRRVDQRRDEDSRRTLAPVIPQACAADARDFGRGLGARAPLRAFIGAKTRKRLLRKRGVPLADASYQIEKQRKRPWCTPVCGFMLQRTMLR